MLGTGELSETQLLECSFGMRFRSQEQILAISLTLLLVGIETYLF